MTTGLAIILFGWVYPLCTVVGIFNGPEAAYILFVKIIEGLGPIVEGVLGTIIDSGRFFF